MVEVVHLIAAISNDVGGAGGTNGGDGINGTDFSGGQGNNLDISTLLMKNFVLTPGQGGEPGQSGWF